MGWVEIFLLITLGLSIYGLGSVACAALAFIIRADAGLALRSVFASLGAPALVLLPIFVIMVADVGLPRGDTLEIAVGMFLAVIPALVVGYPAAFLTGRALDRKRAPALDIFE